MLLILHDVHRFPSADLKRNDAFGWAADLTSGLYVCGCVVNSFFGRSCRARIRILENWYSKVLVGCFCLKSKNFEGFDSHFKATICIVKLNFIERHHDHG